MSTFFLFECSLGYAIFEIAEYEEISQNVAQFQQSIDNFKNISKIIKKINFMPFKTSEEALENTEKVNNNEITDQLKQFLSETIPKKKKSSIKLACVDSDFAKTIHSQLGYDIIVGDFFVEISRAIRQHLPKYLSIEDKDISKSELGLGHSYSRMKCMYDVNRQDKPIIQSIALIDLLDKDINSFCMRIKEWFGWHFPELGKIISDNYVYVRLVRLIEERKKFISNKDEIIPKMDEITLDPEITKSIYEAAVISMGSDISEGDLLNIKFFSDKVEKLIKFRENISNYLKDKMKKLAPNTSALVGEIVSARLISQAGTLSALAKCPASTIQILGAEKALFRALKTRSKTPKYGLLYHSSFIGKAKLKNKGKISRYLANKIAMCSRIDYFSNDRFEDYGNELKNQVEERLVYLDAGKKPRKNLDVMKMVYEKIQKGKSEKNKEDDKETKENKMLNKKREKDHKEEDEDEEESEEIEIVKRKKKKKVKKEEEGKKKKKKKAKKEESEDVDE